MVLDSLKQVDRSSPLLKTASNALPAKKKATSTKQMAPPTNKIATPITQQGVISKEAQLKSKPVLSRSPPPPQTETHGAPPPPPPPPPPLVSKPHPHPLYQRSSSVPTYQRSSSVLTQRRVLLEQVRTSGRRVASKLKPVVTIEKRAFRVGEPL